MAASPCQTCGACCAAYRVTLPLCELDVRGGTVPVALTTPYTRTAACMREAPEAPGRCIALEGVVGAQTRCTIYERRPEACREFAPLALIGIGDESCDAARRRHGLPSLGGL